MEEIKFAPGNYVSKEYIQVIKQLSQESAHNSDGSISRTFATWQNKSNFIVFEPNQKVTLTKDDLLIESIRKLILNGTLVRVL